MSLSPSLSNAIRWSLHLLVFFLPLLLLDQMVKLAVYTSQINTPILGDFFRLQFEKNTGIAFSIALPQWFLVAIIPIFILAIATFLATQLDFKKRFSSFIYALFLAGALGNWLDRINYGYVVDFLAIGGFPVFNLADAFLTVSIFIIILFYDKIKRFKSGN